MALLFCIGKRKRDWILRLRIVYPHGINDIIEDKDQFKSGNKCEDLIGKAFPSLPRIMQRNNKGCH